MATIVTRDTGATAVNRPLTNTELDNNFINLNNAIVSLGSGTGTGTSTSTNTAITVGSIDGGTPLSIYGGNVNVDGGTPNSTFVYTDFKVTTASTPRITSITITDSSYINTDDIVLNTDGGYIKLTGTGFASGCQVVVNNLVATSTTFISATEVRAQLPSAVAGTYMIYLVNSDGGVGIRVNGITYGTAPNWTTTSPLPSQDGMAAAISIQFVASSDTTVTYSIPTGSTLPAGLTLSSTGLLSGTVTGLTTTTSFIFNVMATDLELQDSTKSFSLTITYGEPYWPNTTLMLKTTESVVRSTTVLDSATTPNTVTRNGTPSTGWTSPYQTDGYWGNYFNGSTDYLTAPSATAFAFGSGVDFTVECWVYLTAYSSGGVLGGALVGTTFSAASGWFINSGQDINTLRITSDASGSWGDNITVTAGNGLPLNQWTHIAFVRNGAVLTLYKNGNSVGSLSGASSYNFTSPGNTAYIGFAQSRYVPGYISNVRIVKGTAVYTAAFTPPTIPLTAITNTVLLTCQSNRFKDNSTNNFTLTLNGTPQVTPYYYPSTFTAPAASIGSGYFGGSDYLTVPSNAALSMSSSDFTIEGWYYPMGNATAGVGIVSKRANNGTVGGVLLYYGSTGLTPSLLVDIGGAWAINTASTIAFKSYQWNHFAIVRNGSAFNLYINGVSGISTTNAGAIRDNSDAFVIGADGASGQIPINTGYISNVRVVKGIAVYTGTFTPPTVDFVKISGSTSAASYPSTTNVNITFASTNTSLLLNLADSNYSSAITNGVQNNTFIDSSDYAWAVTRNGTPTQGSVTPYWPNGYWSNNFSAGNTDYLTTPASSLLGTTFTIEFFINFGSFTSFDSNYQCVFGVNNAYNAPGNFIMLANYNGSSFTAGAMALLGQGVSFVAPGGTFVIGTWQHVALVRDTGGTSLRMYVDGRLVASTTTSGSTQFGASGVGYIIAAQNDFINRKFNGYISNLRVVNGTALYTGTSPSVANFIIPSSPLTPITSTTLLTCQSNRFKDNSTNNFTITTSGTPRVQAFQPFSPTASYTAATYGGSGYFNGTTDYLTGTSPSMSGTWTVELWWYPITASTQQTIISFNNGSNGGINIFRNTSNQIGADDGISASPVFTGGTIATNVWNHIAIVRNGLTTTGYINGVSVGSNTFTPATVSAFQIARYNFVSAPYLCSGYISNLRVVVGTAVYTSAFTPPTAPVTAITNTSLLLNCTNAGIYDAAVQNNAITVGDAQASTTVSKWSPTSMKFDGTGDWLTAIDSQQSQLGTGDFTIDGWVYLSATGVAYGIISKGAASTGWSVNVTSGNKLQFSYTASNLTGATSLAATTWYYFAVVRSGSATGNLKVYLNGTADATSGGAVTDNFNQTDILYVGADRVGATPLSGYLQDVRVTKYARTITTPTRAFLTYGILPATGVVSSTYSLSKSTGSVNEGNSFTITLTTSNVANGTTVPYVITGVSSADINAMSLTGNFTVNNNTATLVVIVTADAITEGIENFTLTLTGISPTTSIIVAINDTSVSSIPTYQFATQPASINEGSSGIFNVSTTLVADNTNLFWTINNITTSSADFSATTGYFVVNSSLGSFNITPIADRLTEGSETFTVSIRTGSVNGPVVLTSSSIIINDTSI